MRAAVQPNSLDRFINYVAPVWGARRMHARMVQAIAGGYIGARRDRTATKEWRTTNNSPDADLLPDLAILRDRSRDLARNAPLATGALQTVMQNVCGGGLTLQARPDWEFLGMTQEEADAWTADVEREFSLWAESRECDLTRTQTFYGLQSLVLRSELESGDVITLLPILESPRSSIGLRLQVIEADRLESPRGLRDGARLPHGGLISAGVETDAQGAPLAYWILPTHPGDRQFARAEPQRILAWGGPDQSRLNVIHTFLRLRPGQHRGIPIFAPIMETLKQLAQYTEAELQGTVLASLFTAFVQSETGEGFTPAVESTSQEKKEEIKLGTGQLIDLRPGESIGTFAPNRPNQAFDAFIRSVTQQIGAALGIPFEVLLKHFTASYSASRAAFLDAWRFFRHRREHLANMWCQLVYEAWFEEAVLRGRITAPGFFDDAAIRRAYLLAEWQGDAMPHIDELKEVNAARERILLRLSTRENETRKLTGNDWEDVQRQLVREEAIIARNGGVATVNGGTATDEKGPAEEERQEERGDLEDETLLVGVA